MEHDLLKNGRGGEERCLSQVRKSRVCVSIRECHCNNGYPVEAECGLLHVSRSACNWWASGKSSRYANRGCTRQAKEPQYLAENLLNRQFYAEMPNEKWLTDVTGFKWYEGTEAHKVCLSASLDLCDRRIVAYSLLYSTR